MGSFNVYGTENDPIKHLCVTCLTLSQQIMTLLYVCRHQFVVSRTYL